MEELLKEILVELRRNSEKENAGDKLTYTLKECSYISGWSQYVTRRDIKAEFRFSIL
ncbi:hypothetical protein ACUH7Y_11805 [Clostridium beijerinckii]|uniref:hypothetical protein n=1 Tax=Clostridium beijerinckii TaxID=1520 RepID=UPI001FADCBA3|nr:hypothetical protein [Clostridium beijerinckii]